MVKVSPDSLWGQHLKALGKAKRLSLTGQTFTRWRVVKLDHINDRRETMWQCVCECGNEAIIKGGKLPSGHSKSCGCLREEGGQHLIKHNDSGSPEYLTWKRMRDRCNNPNNPNFGDYGGRGIKICKRWDDYKNFLTDMGRRPSSLYSIERINNDKGYSPSNCR